jgi:penicillin-binding protein 1C
MPIFFLAFHVAVAAWPYPRGIERLPHDSTMLLDGSDTALAELAAPDGQWRTTLSEDQISPHLLKAIVAVEDGRFYRHNGVDWKAAAAAAWQDLTALRAKRGGSTITMQLQRLRQPIAHSFAGKFEQAVRAAQIERTIGKQRILVEYLNLAPFGGNLVGAGAASWRYFGRPCRDLSLAQAALLAGLPKNPTADRPDRFPARAKARRDFVLGRMLSQSLISAAEHAAAIAEPIEAAWRPLPQRANPAVQAALPALARIARQSAGGRIHVTLDPATQQIAATAAREYLEQQADHISEIAVVVVDIASAKGLASVSLSRSGVGDLDLTQRPRSTGSIIKPLIYAAAFDAGISSPDALLDDSPAAWSGYAPANYDTEFRGRITAASALAQSRNIPALRLLSQVGVQRAAGVCGALGLQTIGRTPQRYGLSLAVGGAEATCAEVAEAYATLARDGIRRPVVWLASDEEGDRAVRPSSLSARACRATLACLSDARRTTDVCREAASLEIAWKTGTSSGHRDAWCAAVGPARVVVVWMGNAAGEGSRSLVGGEAAAPLALRLLAAIDRMEHVVPRISPLLAPSRQIAAMRHVDESLTIVSPSDRSEIICDPETKAAGQRVLLRARVSEGLNPANPLFWFIDGLPAGTAKPADPLWWQPAAGEHEVRVADGAGRSARAMIRVR